ncbi:response regulator, partial [Acinetobacter baumannii]
LVVDDNAVARDILVALVSSLKLQVSAVASGEEALAFLRSAAPSVDVVLTDWKMPGMSGAQLLRIIKRECSLPKVPAVILVTAYGSEDVSG